ncbi:MAG: Ig-like domain-containing protein [Candidatus Sulfotelmatobacter sp.]
MQMLTLVAGDLICGLVGLIGIAVLWQIYDGTIDLSRLISETNGDASMGRFQFLVFTFVISLSLFLVIAAGKDGEGKKPAFPDSIPAGVLTLLGISGSSYAVGKAIQFSDPAGLEDRPVTVTISPSTVTVKYGQKQQFTAEVTRKPDAKVKWEVIAGPAAPDDARIDENTGLFAAPARASAIPAPHATVRATLVDYPDVSDVAVVTFSA